jgi:hypothetical protein
MAKTFCILFGLIALLGPVVFAFNMAGQESIKSFWEFYPLFISGILLSMVFFFAATRFHKKQKSSS